MRYLIMIAILVSGWVSAQEFNETIVVNDLQYSVVDRQFNHVFDAEDGTPVKFRVASVSSSTLEIDTYIGLLESQSLSDFETKFPRVQGMSQHEYPFLRYYVNGGMQKQHFAHSTHDFILQIDLEGVNHINLQWEWRGEIVQYRYLENGLREPTGTTYHPSYIGRRWFIERN